VPTIPYLQLTSGISCKIELAGSAQLVEGLDTTSYRVAFFQTAKHLGFVASGMNQANNLAMARRSRSCSKMKSGAPKETLPRAHSSGKEE
jgi:hypothetical protein